MCVPGHDVVAINIRTSHVTRRSGVWNLHISLSAAGDDLEEGNKIALNLTNTLAQPHSHIGNDLLVSAATSVKLSTDLLTNDLR